MINLQENILAHQAIKKMRVFLELQTTWTSRSTEVLVVETRLNLQKVITNTVDKMLGYKSQALSHCFDIMQSLYWF